VIREAGEPLQFLSVIYASKLPGGRGAAQVLPVANDLYSLATFENLRNAYGGPDGQSVLVYAVERFAAAHPQHVTPLRLVLVNAPQAGTLLLDLLKLMDRRKRNYLPALRVEVRGTLLQAPRLQESLLFDTKQREIIEEKVASGRLTLWVDRQPKPLDEILAELQARPAHLVAVFDEAPVSVRRGGAGERLPMSPFCVRRKVAFHRHWNELRLEPTSGDPPFFEFIELIKHVEGNEGEGTPYAWPEAEALRKSVDSVLMPDEFGAQWFLLADRALPEEGEMRAQRLARRREGQRQVLLAARSYESIARLMLRVFEDDTPNLLMPAARLQDLLSEGAHLIGAGLLDVVKSQDGKVAPGKVIGLMGALLTAREYLRRHPGALLVSTDSQLARTWLRLGTQGERCDLLGLYEENARLVVESIEVKTTKGAPRSRTDAEISRACVQVEATLEAVREGLGDTEAADQSGRFLAAPRNEMLKEVLVQGCMGRFATGERRASWAGWLTRLFGPTPETPELRGTVVDVALGSAQKLKPETLTQRGLVVRVEHINEIDVQRLLEPAESDDPPDAHKDGDGSDPSDPPTGSSGGGETAVTGTTRGDARDILDTRSGLPMAARRLRNSTDEHIAEPSDSQSKWPPAENVFGLIGQHAAATKLLNKLELARGTGRRFTDTLFVGPAGVGKSSLARAVAKRLLDEDPVFSSGSDLPQPAAIIERLRERGKVSSRARNRVRVASCLVFIDEVHALPRKTATALLSAMDDTRIAPIGGAEYDFADVVFIAATTDKGLLSEAFVSRMDLIPLADYSLDELAGIIWLHGGKLFGGFQLAHEVCVEVAARNRCNPRRAVRSLENDLLAEFYSHLPANQRKHKNAERSAAELMTRDSVAAYYDAHGIDLNGLDDQARRTLDYLKRHGGTSEDRLCRGVRISNRADFVELIEYLTRLGLVATGHAGRSLTTTGRSYLAQTMDLRSRI
jgi:Holliday junction DNA helicase RuvB